MTKKEIEQERRLLFEIYNTRKSKFLVLDLEKSAKRGTNMVLDVVADIESLKFVTLKEKKLWFCNTLAPFCGDILPYGCELYYVCNLPEKDITYCGGCYHFQ